MKSQNLLFLDTQTTGMRPPRGALLEIAWTVTSGQDQPFLVESHTVQLPEGHSISKQVQDITGFQEPHAGLSSTEVADQLLLALEKLGDQPLIAIHYAQFEKPFLQDLLGERLSSIPVICTQQLSKLLLPELPSPNIRAVAGFFGQPLTGLNRAGPFTAATVHIWRGLCERLQAQSLKDYQSLHAWMQSAEKPKSTRYAYRIEQLKRLSLPDRPGVYRMLTKTGEILYVGKATSLKDRVNSYFRGKKGRDRKKLEMLAHVWNFKITETRSALEAAVLETDEIKKHNPRYNNLLKTGRQIVFYNRDFSARDMRYSAEFKIGPFREHSLLESLRLIQASLKKDTFEMIFYQPIEESIMRQGWLLFASQHGLSTDSAIPMRQLVGLAIRLFRKLGIPEPRPKIDEESEETPLTPEELAAKFQRLFRRTGAECIRARLMTKVLNCDIEYEDNGQKLQLAVRGGNIEIGPKKKTQTIAWDGLGLETYDRISILLSELSRCPHRLKSSVQTEVL